MYSDAVSFSEQKVERAFARGREGTIDVDGGSVGNTRNGFDGSGRIGPDHIIATVRAGITHERLLIGKHTTSPIAILLPRPRSATASACRHIAAEALLLGT
jgi:hypothetical protein